MSEPESEIAAAQREVDAILRRWEQSEADAITDYNRAIRKLNEAKNKGQSAPDWGQG